MTGYTIVFNVNKLCYNFKICNIILKVHVPQFIENNDSLYNCFNVNNLCYWVFDLQHSFFNIQQSHKSFATNLGARPIRAIVKSETSRS